MTSAHLLASGPVKLRAQSLPSTRDRHVHHVVGCSNQQRDSTLRWGRKPAKRVQAVSEEIVDSVAENGLANGNGTMSEAIPLKQSTLSVHAGESGGRCKVADSLTTPICCTSTYYFQDTAELIAYQEGRYGSYEYGRWAACSFVKAVKLVNGHALEISMALRGSVLSTSMDIMSTCMTAVAADIAYTFHFSGIRQFRKLS